MPCQNKFLIVRISINSLKKICIEYHPSDWRLFIESDSSTKSLKAVLMHNGNHYQLVKMHYLHSNLYFFKENLGDVIAYISQVFLKEELPMGSASSVSMEAGALPSRHPSHGTQICRQLGHRNDGGLYLVLGLQFPSR